MNDDEEVTQPVASVEETGESEVEEEEFISDAPEAIAEFNDSLHIITIMYDTCSGETPELDLGDCSPWIAMTLLQSAMDTVQMMIPPVNVSYRGRKIIEHEFDIVDPEDDC